MKTIIGFAVALTLVACGEQRPLDVTCDGCVNAPAWVHSDSMKSRTVAIAGAAAGAWGGSLDDLEWWTVRYTTEIITYCNPITGIFWGCTGAGDIGVFLQNAPCPEMTSLAHEIGHVIIGDHDHADPRWKDREFWGHVATLMLAADPEANEACSSVSGQNEVYYRNYYHGS
jgi:hypothetical protein